MDPVQERIGELLRAHDAGSKYLHRSLFSSYLSNALHPRTEAELYI